jgi:hypothetical protein
MPVLIDTSAWIEYFRSGNNSEKIDFFIDENLIATNDLILAKLVPFLKVQNQHKIIELLNNIKKLTLSIDWNQLMEFQIKCLKNGINGIGIPVLIIAQNAKQHRCMIYSLDSHFKLIQNILGLKLTN